jgi:hypothetical protein
MLPVLQQSGKHVAFRGFRRRSRGVRGRCGP